MIISAGVESTPFKEYLSSVKEILKNVFRDKENNDKLSLERRFPTPILQRVMDTNPLAVAVPTEYGGRGVKVKECLGVLDAASYESLPLALTFGINIALFLEPVAKYAQNPIKENLYKRFLTQQNMGGLMITEPDYGSDALSMQTTNVKSGSDYKITGTKHWQGLTGMADYWLMSSRRKFENGDLARDIDFFICDNQQASQAIHVEEYYNNLGLYPIPYGRNKVDIKVPEENKLVPESTGLKLMMDLLHRSRFQFPAMGSGFIRRILDEAMEHTKSRIVGGKSLFSLDQVRHQVARIQSAFTISSALCSRSAETSGIENDLSASAIEANSIKAYITDLMQESAQTLTQLSGANGYKAESLGSRAIVDSRPFQIFEGSNEMLFTQISEMVTKMMGRQRITSLAEFFKNYELTQNVADYFKALVDFNVDIKIPQRKNVDLGKIISRVISANHVAELGAKGFRSDLIADSLETIKHEISMLISSFKFETKVSPVEEYKDNSSWLSFC